jgi:hypothetical protein
VLPALPRTGKGPAMVMPNLFSNLSLPACERSSGSSITIRDMLILVRSLYVPPLSASPIFLRPSNLRRRFLNIRKIGYKTLDRARDLKIQWFSRLNMFDLVETKASL